MPFRRHHGRWAQRRFDLCVLRESVTGMQKQIAPNLAKQVPKIRTHTKLPVAVGFGVSNPEQPRLVAQNADAVVVSTVVNQIAEHGNSQNLVADTGQFVKKISQAI
jgi:tryptophan synthase alpha chain